MSPTVAAARAVSKRTIKITSSQRLAKLKQIQVQKSSKSKLNWALSAFHDWRNERLETMNYNVSIYCTELDRLERLDKSNFY